MKKFGFVLLIFVFLSFAVSTLAATSAPTPAASTESEYGSNGARRLLGLRQRRPRVIPLAVRRPCKGDDDNCTQIRAQARCQRELYRITRAWTHRDSDDFWKTAKTHKVAFSLECCDVVSTFREYYKENSSREILFNPAAISLIEANCINLMH